MKIEYDSISETVRDYLIIGGLCFPDIILDWPSVTVAVFVDGKPYQSFWFGLN